ncbi:hypothetical protein [Prosthecobacter sp.]|uniref:hypothetical protein n=1 Tax=Prosthecobacter sp. TaxID=1965333 RepID=UPI003782D8EA
MQRSAAFLFLLLPLSSLAEPAIPPSVQKYLEVLRKRPEPGTIFERFYAAWMEEGSAASLLEHLSAQAARPGAAAADHLILALLHSHRGDDHEALTSYHAALQLDARNASAWLECARIEMRLLDFTSALASLEKAEAAGPTEALALDLARLKGRVLLRLERNDEALALWHEMVRKNGDHQDLIEEIIDWFADEAQYEAAIEAARALVKRTRDPLARTLRQLRLADILLMADRSDESLSVLDTAFAATGAETWIEADVLSRIDRVFRMTDDIEGLEKHLAELAHSNPQRVTLGWQHTLLLATTGHAGEALSAARTLLKANPGRRDLQDQFLDLLDSLNQPQEAVAQAQALSRQNPADKELLIRLAGLQQRAKDPAAASATLESYVTAAGVDEAALLRAARLQESWETSPAKGEPPAFKAYARLRSAFPESLSAQEACAHYLHRSGRREEALALWKSLAKNAAPEGLLRMAQALQARQEPRAALDILTAREAELSQQPRFLALLVQSALANEEFERALPWALARLRLMREADGIEDAMTPLRTLLQTTHSARAPALMKELRQEAALTIQNRCLLAMLLNESGDAPAAAQTLMAAPAADAPTALMQLTKLQQSNRDWAGAAQTLKKVLALPNARTAARLQLLVDVLRRAGQPAKALEQIPEWKKLTPSAIEPWLVEARVLGELQRAPDALKVLRQAVRKFPDAAETAHAYATACLGAGDAEEAERIYLALYEKTTDTAARLRLLPPLAQAAQQHQALPRLVENFQRRQQQNRASAFPWLALAEIHRATQNREARLRCLYEASRLRPQDLELLLEIARHEETEGLYPEAIRTLEAAARLDKSTKVRERLAKLQIENGDPDAGYRLLFDLAGGGQMSPEAVEQIADAMALRGDWKNIPALLQPLLEKHPRHYRLHYLCGVAQEESGQENAALATFLHVMDMHEEIPGTPPAVPSGDMRSLPAGTEDWMRFADSATTAYAYQQQGRELRYAWRQNVSAQASLIALPVNVLQSPAFALAHALRITSHLPPDEQQRIVTQLRRTGIADAPLLLEAELSPAGFGITPELLAAHPEHAALHAAWLLGHGDEWHPGELDRCFELFKNQHPDLSLFAANEVLQKEAVENGELWITRLIHLASSLTRFDHREWESLAHLLLSQFPELSSPPKEPAAYLTPEETQECIALLHRWMRKDAGLKDVRDIIPVFIAHERWEAAIDGFERMFELSAGAGTPVPLPSPAGMAGQPYSRWNARPLPLIAADTGMPADMVEVLVPMLETLDEEADAAAAESTSLLAPLFHMIAAGKDRRKVQEFQDAVRRRSADVHDARLRLFLRLLAGDARALLAEQEAGAQRSKASLQEVLFTGWLHQFFEEDQKALGMFNRAAGLTRDARLLEHLDSACLSLAMKLQQPEGSLELPPHTLRRVLDRLLKEARTAVEKTELVTFLQGLGLHEEAERLLPSIPETPAMALLRSPAPNHRNPYSSLLSTGRHGGTQDLLDRFLLGDQDALALTEACRRARWLAARWLATGSGGDEKAEMATMLIKLGMHNLRESFLIRLQTDARTNWERRVDYAAVLEMQHAHGKVLQNNDGSRTLSLEELRSHAIQEYEAVLAANPQAQNARRHLVLALALEDGATALRHWKALPEPLQPALLFPLIDKARNTQDATQVTEMTRFITTWLKGQDPARPLPYQTKDRMAFVLQEIEEGKSWPSVDEVFGPGRSGHGNDRWNFDASGALKLTQPLRRQRNERRIAHEALCRAMMRFPELAEMGFAPLAGLAIFEQRDLPGMEQLALQILALRGSVSPVQRQAAPRPPPAGSNRLFEGDFRIASPPAAFFATWNAVRRGDAALLENVIYPAILKADGQPMLDFCREYAGIVLADDADFSTAAGAWVNRWVPVSYASSEAFSDGGMVHEVVRMWEARPNAAPLDDLFLPYKAVPIAPRDAMDNNPLILAPTPYVDALLKRDPAELRRFLLRIREAWISPDAEVRRQAMKRHLAHEASGKAHRDTQTERAAGSFLEWLNYLMQNRGSQAAFEAAAEDGALDAKERVQNVIEEKESVQSSGEFMILLRHFGYLQGGKGKRVLSESWDEPGHALWLARRFRETKEDARIVALLGSHQPAGFDTDLLQAMFMHEEIKSFHLGGRPVSLVPPPESALLTRREMAYRLVILHYATEIAAMPVEERKTLGSFLQSEQPRLMRLSAGDPELRQALEPVTQASRPDGEKADAAR